MLTAVGIPSDVHFDGAAMDGLVRSSLVGPRPHAIAMDDAFAEVISNFYDRHLVRPGLTGLAQVSGYRGPTEALEQIEYRVQHDRLYISKWSVFLDMKIMVQTVFALTGPNAL